MDTTKAPQIIEHTSKNTNGTPTSVAFVPGAAMFVCGTVTSSSHGELKVYEMKKGELAEVDCGKLEHGVQCLTFGASSHEKREICCGDQGGNLSIYDLDNMKSPSFSVKAHDGLINSVDGCGGLNLGHGAPEIVSGGRDGCVRVWDPRTKKPVLSLEPASSEPKRDCWAVCFGNSFNDEERCICAGYDNGDVKLFDLRTSAMIWQTNVGNGVVSVQFDRKDIPMNKLLVTTLESKFHVFDMRTHHPTKGFAQVTEKAHKSTIWPGRHLPQNRDLFMTGGGNGGINIYKYNYPSQRTALADDDKKMGVAGSVELLNSRIVSPQALISFDWSPDKEGLGVAACLDQTVKVFIVTRLEKF